MQQSINEQGAFTLNSNGQTSIQAAAATQLDSILSLLNTQVGSNYLFSGSATNQPSVASTNSILNGNGAQAGLTQVITERPQADVGSGLGRLLIPATGGGSIVTVSEDVAGSPFGFKLASVNSTLTGATVTGPSGSPKSISVDLRLDSESRRFDPVQFHAARRHQPDHYAASHGEFAARRQPVHDRRDAGGDRDQPAGGADHRRRQSGADRIAGGVCDRRRQQLLQFESAAAGKRNAGNRHLAGRRHARQYGVLVHG